MIVKITTENEKGNIEGNTENAHQQPKITTKWAAEGGVHKHTVLCTILHAMDKDR